MIHEVYEEGAAARDGRLWAGDQILEVYDYDFYFVPVHMVSLPTLIHKINLSICYLLLHYILTYFSPI